VTKTTQDLSLYHREFNVLREQLTAMETEEFNGISLFGAGQNALTVVTSEDGVTQTIGISQTNLNAINTTFASSTIGSFTGAQAAVTTVAAAIETLAQTRAQNGAEQSRLGYALDMLKINKGNLEAANSRIIDVDVAAESTQLARFNILQQAGTAMLAQANQATQSILRLIS
jgi:flagellin